MAERRAAPHWRLGAVVGEPWRLGFGCGAALLVLAALWWPAVLVLQPVGWQVPRALAHAALMALGPWPLFIAGFAFTAFPRWLKVRGPSIFALRPALLAQLVGWLAWLAGAQAASPLAAAGLALVALGQADLARRAALLVRASAVHDRLHPALITGGLAIASMALAAAAAATALHEPEVALACVLTGFWGGVALVFTAAADRLVPAFGLAEGHDRLLLALGTTCALLRAVDPWVAAHPAWCWLLAAAQALAALAIFRGALAWSRERSLRTPLVRALFLGVVWLAIGWLLGAADAVARALGAPPPVPHGDLHAMGLGAFGLLLAGMVSRLAAAHGARPIVLTAAGRWLLPALQGAVVLRLLAAVVTLPTLLLAAALAWALALGSWALRILHEAGLEPAPRP